MKRRYYGSIAPWGTEMGRNMDEKSLQKRIVELEDLVISGNASESDVSLLEEYRIRLQTIEHAKSSILRDRG